MLKSEVLILELFPKDTFPSSAVRIGDVTSSADKPRNDSMEDATLISIAFPLGAESNEIIDCYWYDVISQLEE